MEETMKLRAIFTRYWKIAVLIAALTLAYFAYTTTRDMLKSWAYGQAKTIYEQRIATAEADKQAALKERDALSEAAGRDREALRKKAEDEKRKSDAAFAIFKSESAAKLRERNATIAQVLVEKEKDEMAIVEAKETIDNLVQFNYLQGVAWKLSDERIEEANKKAMDALTLQFVTCQKWTATLEKSIKPTFWKRVKEYGKYALAFGAGRASAGVF
jgi:hypothetical protein